MYIMLRDTITVIQNGMTVISSRTNSHWPVSSNVSSLLCHKYTSIYFMIDTKMLPVYISLHFIKIILFFTFTDLIFTYVMKHKQNKRIKFVKL